MNYFHAKKSLKAQKTLFLSRKKLFYFHVNSMHKCSKKVFKKRGNFSIDRELSLKEDEICDMIYCYIGLGKYNKMWLKCKLNSYNYSLCLICSGFLIWGVNIWIWNILVIKIHARKSSFCHSTLISTLLSQLMVKTLTKYRVFRLKN